MTALVGCLVRPIGKNGPLEQGGFWVVTCCEPHSAKEAKPLKVWGDYMPLEGQRGSRLRNDGQESSLINKMNNGADY